MKSRQKMSVLTNRLRLQSRNITGPCPAILEVLRRHPHLLTDRKMLSEMFLVGATWRPLYRAVQHLGEMGLVKRFDFGDGAARFELFGDNDDGHHYPLVCT